MKAYWGGWRYSSTHSLTSALDGGEWSASRPGRFTPTERAPGTHWIGGWVGPRAVLDAVTRKIPSPRRQSNPRTPIVQPVAQRYTDRCMIFRHKPPTKRFLLCWLRLRCGRFSGCVLPHRTYVRTCVCVCVCVHTMLYPKVSGLALGARIANGTALCH
jgi:hypothetical protein